MTGDLPSLNIEMAAHNDAIPRTIVAGACKAMLSVVPSNAANKRLPQARNMIKKFIVNLLIR